LQQQFVCRYGTSTTKESGSLFWCYAVMSLQFTELAPLPAETGCETFYWPLLRNNNMATNVRRCSSGYGGRRFAACNYWT